MLARGGKAVYIGDRRFIHQYFRALGFTCPSNVNPSDFYLDVVQGKCGETTSACVAQMMRESNVNPALAEAGAPTSLDAIWRVVGAAWLRNKVGSEVAIENSAPSHRPQLQSTAALPSTFATQTYLSFQRAIIQHLRGHSLLLDCASQFVSRT
jgi:hypothetical protein